MAKKAPEHNSNQTLYLVIIAAVFLMGGLLIGSVFGSSGGDDNGGNIDSNELNATVAAMVATQVAAVPTSPPTATPPVNVDVADSVDDDAFLGPVDAPVVIVEFSDFQCGYCGVWFRETLPQILEAYPDEVKFIYRDWPIFGDNSVRAAMATECAEEQGQFWPMHNIIFEKMQADERPTLDQATLVAFAGELNMDTDSFEECMTSQRYLEEIQNDYNDAASYVFNGTPSFVINGTIYRIGASPFATFDRIIRDELAALDQES
jgi:protein-disulfide isomerase